MKRATLILAQLLGLIFLVWLLYPNKPLTTTGGVVKISPSQSPGQYTNEKEKILEIDILTDAEKINFLNQKRKLDKLIEYSNNNDFKNKEELLAEKSPFEPLIVIRARGPLNIKIKSSVSFQGTSFSIPEGEHTAEVYPQYKPSFLKDIKGNITEKLWIYSQKSRGPWRQEDVIEIHWSGERDLFLSHENLIDLASLTNSRVEKYPEIPPNDWLKTMGEKIKSLNLRYETELVYKEGENQGWQKIRNLDDMIDAKSANCIDLCVYVCSLALASGYKAYIIANSGHALCAISLPSQTAKEAIIFETTDFLRPPLKPPEKPGQEPREYLPEEKIIYPERQKPREEENKEVYIVDLDFWSKFYH